VLEKRWKKADVRNRCEIAKMMEHVEHLGKRGEKGVHYYTTANMEETCGKLF
jgi:hypothetical protein